MSFFQADFPRGFRWEFAFNKRSIQALFLFDDPVQTDLSFPTGYENANANSYVPPSDGVFVIQCEPAEGYAYYNLTVRRDQLDCGFVGSYGQTWPVLETPCRKGETIHWYTGIDGAAQNIKAHIRFYPYIGS